MPFFFISCTFSGVYPCACIHCRANSTGEYQKAPSTKVRSAATRMATMLTVAVGIGSPLGSELSYEDRKSTRLNSSHSQISYAVFCLQIQSQHDARRSRTN